MKILCLIPTHTFKVTAECDVNLKCDALTLHMILWHIICLEAFEKKNGNILGFGCALIIVLSLMHLELVQQICTFIKLGEQGSGLVKSVPLLIVMVVHCRVCCALYR